MVIPDIRRLVPRTSEEGGVWLYVLHLLTVWALALSNVFMGLAVLVSLENGLKAPWRGFAAVLRPLGLYALFVLAAIAGSYDPRLSLGGARELLSLITLPLAFVLLRDEETRIRRLVDAVVVLGALLGAYGLGQLLFGFGGLYQRIRGPFSHWMTFAGVLVICLLLVAARLAHRPRSRLPWRWAALAIMAAALVMSLTRSAWVALLLALVVLLALRAPRYLAAVPVAGLLLVLLAPVPVVERMTSVFDVRGVSNYDRLCMAEAGLLMISEKPLFGIGPEMVRQRYPIYHHASAPRRSTPHLHNTFLQIGAENGLPALAAYLWLMGGTALLAFRRFRAEGGWAGSRADLYIGVVLVLLGFNLAGLFEDNWADTEVQRLVLFVLAIPHCLPARSNTGSAVSA
ncbi:MAG: O-antigen ligase family protein [Thermoanaerobaculia bacterium]